MTRDTFDRNLRLLAATWPDRSPSADTTAAYWLALGDLSDDVFTKAVRECLRRCTFFPAPAEIIARAEDILTRAGALPPDPEQAWVDVLAHANESGTLSYHRRSDDTRPECPVHPLADRVVREIASYHRISNASANDLPFVRTEFIGRYELLRRRMVADQPAMMRQSLARSADTLALADSDRDARIADLRRQNEESLRALAE